MTCSLTGHFLFYIINDITTPFGCVIYVTAPFEIADNSKGADVGPISDQVGAAGSADKLNLGLIF